MPSSLQAWLTAATVLAALAFLTYKLVLAPARRERGPHVRADRLVRHKRTEGSESVPARGAEPVDHSAARSSSSSAGAPEPRTDTLRP